MSRLVHDTSKHDEPEVAPVLLPLSPAVMVKHLKACQKLAKAHVDKAFDKFIPSLLEAYDIELDNAVSNKQTTDLIVVQRTIKKKSDDLRRYFTGYYLECFVKFSKKKLNTSLDASSFSIHSDDLSIVENDQLEETISISSITQRVDTYFAEPLWALNQRFSILNNGEPVTESGNPVAPIQFCDALRRALKLLDLTPDHKAIVYKVFDLHLLNLFQEVSQEVNAYLGGQGILPHLKFNVPKGLAPRSYLTEESDKFGRRARDHGLEDEEASTESPTQVDLLKAIRGLQQQVDGVSSNTAYQAGKPAYDPQQLVAALSGLQRRSSDNVVDISTATQQSLPRVNIADVLAQLKQRLSEENNNDGDVKRDDMQTIDLVGMVFEYMLNDENIPDSVKTVLSYLHTPFLKIAFMDPHFFERTEHPARILLNALADAGAKWVGNDGSSQFDMYDQIKNIVNRVLKEFDNDVKIITSLLFEFNSYVKKASRKQELTEKRAKEKAEGEDKLREMKLKVNDEVRKRIRDKELPSAVLLLLLQPWSDYLTFILLRHGDTSEKWTKGLALVDDILWCIDPNADEIEKQDQSERLESVIDALREGFDVIGFEASKSDKLIESFRSLCDLALKSQRAEPAPEPMRNELERIAAERAGEHFIESDDITPEEAQMVESLKMIEFGTWFEFEGGKRLKVAWYNGRTSHYMLVDQMGKRVDMESGLALARKMISGTAKIISGSSKPFFERALENIYQKLHEKAEITQSETVNAKHS